MGIVTGVGNVSTAPLESVKLVVVSVMVPARVPVAT